MKMKKITVLTVLVILTGSIFGQSNNNRNLYEKHKNNIWVLDTIYGYTGQTNTWFLDYSEIVTAKNEKGLPTIIETKDRELGNYTWYEGYYVTLSYFDNDSLNEYKLWEWNTNTNNWNSEMSVYILYDENGLKLEYYDRAWDNTDEEFLSGNKEIYTYDENNFLITKEDIDWGWETLVWEDWKTTTYTNNNLGLCIEQIEVFATNVNYLQIFYTYNDDNQLTNELEKLWYGSSWEDYSRTTYTYYENELLHEELFERFNDDWENVVKLTSIYDDNNLLISYESHAYDGVSTLDEYTYNENGDELTYILSEWIDDDHWSPFYKVSDFYDENFNQTEYWSENREISGGAWTNFLKEEYTWNSFQTANLESFNTKINIYPNPASEKILIDYNSNKIFNVEMFTILGKKVKELKNTKKIDVSDLKSGIYFMKISNQNFNYTKKIIIN